MWIALSNDVENVVHQLVKAALYSIVALFGLRLGHTWLAFPLAELIFGSVGFALYPRTAKQRQTAATA